MSTPTCKNTFPESPHLPVTRGDLLEFCDKLIAEVVRAIANQVSSKEVSILRMPEVTRRSGFAKSSIYQKVAAGEFPPPVDLGGGRGIGWRSDAVDEWIASRPRPQRRSVGRVKQAAHEEEAEVSRMK